MLKVDLKQSNQNDVWFIYDGECPICCVAANGLAIKETIGKLNLLNARENNNHPLMLEINSRGLNLDKGMVIKVNDNYFHGADALQVMGLIGTNQGWFNRMNYLFLRSKFSSRLFYPFLKGTRNLLIKLKGVGKIKNLEETSHKFVTFKPVFGDQWKHLPDVMQKHYANRAYTNDTVTMTGTMDVEISKFAKIISPVLRVFGALVPYEGSNIPVTVTARSHVNTAQYIMDREFQFSDQRRYNFVSKLERVEKNEMIEFMRFGVGWRSAFVWEDEKVKLKHRGYAWRVLGWTIPIPGTILLGKGYAEEEPISDDCFQMLMHITHPWWGKVYEYRGTFKI